MASTRHEVPSATPMDTAVWPPVTTFGRVLPAVLPVPSCPCVLRPQQRTAPPEERPQVCVQDTSTCFQVVDFPTRVGRDLSAYEPMPSWPNRLRPQHQSDPLVLVAQVVQPPAETVFHFPGTCCRFSDCLVVPWPS